MTTVDPAFNAVPKKSTTFLIWRVENLQLVPVKKEDYGKFHTGDSYLVYSAFEPGQPLGVDIKPRESNGRVERFIHFWLGAQTTQDEAGVAAIKAVELDDYLGGSPVQQREVEGSESTRFLSYFSNGIRLLPGGVNSGFKHVTDEFNPSLYSVKGKRIPVVRHLPTISWSVMNQGDVYVLDNKKYVFVWIGREANNHEKMFAAKLAQTLKSDHGTTECTIVIVEDNQELALPDDERKAFNSLLPIHEKKLQAIEAAGSDDQQESSVVNEIKLYECSDEGGTLKVTEIKKGPLYQRDLNSNNSFIIDNGINGVYVWIGKKASQQERNEAMSNAQGFAKKKEYSSNTKIVRVIDGGEPPEFKSLFRGWKDRNQTEGIGRQYSVGKIAKMENTVFDAATLHEKPKLASETGMVDDGTGKKEVFRILNSDLSPIPVNDYGKFYGGDCYVVNYTYHVGTSEQNIIYYWLGSTSGQDEKGTAALKAIELDNKMGGRAVQVRVVQGKEPKHFVAMFGGKLIIFAGGKASSFESQQGEKDEALADTYLLQVRGNAGFNTKAVEVPLKASSLNSNDVFVLMTSRSVYIWCGKGSTGDEREMAKKIASEGKADPIIVSEGCEKPEFWELLGGKTEYWTDMRTADEYEEQMPRLFHCSNASGSLKVEEILDFCQSDLVEEDVMVLDVGQSVYVWIGVNSNRDEVAQVEKLVLNYLKSDPKGRDPDTPIMKIRQGCEPPTFTGFFGVWDPNNWENRMNFDKLKEQMKKDNPSITIAISSNGHGRNFYPMEVLLEKDPERLPADVDLTCKEDFLHDLDFKKAFNMDREAFSALPLWKRQNLKKVAGIF